MGQRLSAEHHHPWPEATLNRGSTRLPNNDLVAEYDVAPFTGLFRTGFDLLDQQAKSFLGETVNRLMHGGERGPEHYGGGRIIETDDGKLVWHVELAAVGY